TLLRAAPRAGDSPTLVVLSPGVYNSAFFEHSFLAREMGAVLVEGRDLIVEDNHVFMRTTRGRQRVDVIYRRIDDDFLDPLAFRSDDFAYMREHLGELVVKTTGDSGGYGMLMGPFASKKEIETYAAQMRKNPSGYVAQPLIQLSAHPTYTGGAFNARRIDLRPFILYGDRVRVLPGGLTRVALREGSYVVNSSQGGGSKDTWVLAARTLGSCRQSRTRSTGRS